MLQYAEYVDRWAIVVGISRYGHASLSLRYAHRDADEFCSWLQTPSGGGFPSDHIVKLIDEDATTANITRALRSFLQKPAREDVVLVYFACHGGPDPQRPSNIYLLTHDTNPDDIAGTALPMREIDLALRENLLAERVVIIADTCHSSAIGANRRNVAGTAEVNRYLQELSRSKPGTALLTSAEASETAQEGSQWGGGHGVFTHFLLEGLRGAADRSPVNGTVTVGELFEYVRESVTEATQGSQHPTIGPNVFDRGFPMAVTGDITVKEHFELGQCLYEFGRRLCDPVLLDAALRRLREADRLSTERRADVQAQIGRVMLAQNRKEEAVRAFREALAIDDGSADAWYYLSILEPSSVARHETFLARFPDDPRAAFVKHWQTDSGAGAKNCAIVVGIDEYPKIPDLVSGGSRNDATEIAIVLRLLGFEDKNVEVLLDATATKPKILSLFEKLAGPTKSIRSFLFYYSGVGFCFGTGLVAHDSVKDASRVDTVLTTRELHEAIISVRATHKVLVIEGTIEEELARLAMIGGYIVFSATSPNEQSHLTLDGAHGAFTFALIKELNELENSTSRLCSVDELRKRVARQMDSSVRQNPVVWGDPSQPLVQGQSYPELAFELAEARYYGKYSAQTLDDLLDWMEREDLHDSNLALSLARAFLDKGYHKRTIGTLGRMPNEHGRASSEALFLLTLANLSGGEKDIAAAAIGRLVAVKPTWSRMLDQEIARLLFALGDYQNTAVMCRPLVSEQMSGGTDAHALLGLAQTFLGDEAALVTLSRYWEERTQTEEESRLQRIARFLVTGEGGAERFGILVGISTYPRVPLRASRAETERFRDVLVERYGFEPSDLVVLLDGDATRHNIIVALEHAAAQVYHPASFVFFFSGHCTHEPTGPELPNGYRDNYFPVDGISASGPDNDRGISGSELHELICRIPVEDKTVILDAGGPEMTKLASASGAYLLLTSASPGQYTMDGVFSPVLIDELCKRTPGMLTAGELIEATAARMGPRQTGTVKGSYPGAGDEYPTKSKQTPRGIGDSARVLFQARGASSFSQRVPVARLMAQRWLDPIEIGRALVRCEYQFTDCAVEILTRSLRTRPENRPETYLHLGIALGLQGHYTRAVNALNRAISQSPNDTFAKAHYYLGRFLFESSTDYDQAVAELRLATQQDKTEPNAHYFLAQAIRTQFERQSRAEAAAAYRAYAAAGAPLGIDPELIEFAFPSDQKLPDAARDDLVALKDPEPLRAHKG